MGSRHPEEHRRHDLRAHRDRRHRHLRAYAGHRTLHAAAAAPDVAPLQDPDRARVPHPVCAGGDAAAVAPSIAHTAHTAHTARAARAAAAAVTACHVHRAIAH
eukprot:1343733-Prymnesium_polylepis.1